MVKRNYRLRMLDPAKRVEDNSNKLKWYYKNLSKGRLIQRDATRRRRDKVLSHYGSRCACCGEANYEFLAIDHINGGGLAHLKKINRDICRWLIKNKFPEGFRVLCHNCNLSLGFYKYCPHSSPDAHKELLKTLSKFK